ncbi:hypothetical protein ACFLT1_05725 [Bacteroidota bacterium]
MKSPINLCMLAILCMLTYTSRAQEYDVGSTSKESLVATLEDDNSLLIVTDYFVIKFPSTMEYPEIKEVDVLTDGVLDMELWVIYASDMFEREFTIYPLVEDLQINGVEQQCSSTLLFNEDGSGATWSIDDVDVAESEWNEIEQLDEFTYLTLSTYDFEFSLSEESYIAAEEYIANKEIETSYSLVPIENRLRIFWNQEGDGDESLFEINFTLVQGD